MYAAAAGPQDATCWMCGKLLYMFMLLLGLCMATPTSGVLLAPCPAFSAACSSCRAPGGTSSRKQQGGMGMGGTARCDDKRACVPMCDLLDLLGDFLSVR